MSLPLLLSHPVNESEESFTDPYKSPLWTQSEDHAANCNMNSQFEQVLTV